MPLPQRTLSKDAPPNMSSLCWKARWVGTAGRSGIVLSGKDNCRYR
jgi:hypothetical protein